MKKTMLLLVVLIALCVAGCVESMDPATGETVYNVDPDAAAKVERGVEAGIGVLQALSIFWPELLPAGVVIGLGGALATWRKMKPKLTEAQAREALYFATTEEIVTAIEQYKTDNPAAWKKLGDEIGDKIGPEAENVIRAIRGLKPKT